MTGNELAEALILRLREALPEIEVRAAYTGEMMRRPGQAVLCIGLLREAQAESVGSVKLGVWLYTPARQTAVDIFAAVCNALEAIPCTVRSVTREEAKYDGTVRCMVTPCTIEATVSAAAENRVEIRLGEIDCTADGVSVCSETQAVRYGSVGEEKPHTVVAGNTTYRVTISGLDAPPAVLELENFAADISGVRYAPCVWRSIRADQVIFEAGGVERLCTEESGDA